MVRSASVTILLVGLFVAGCSGKPSRIEPPSIPDNAATDAVAQFDKNGDKTINDAELDQILSIKSAMKRIDLDNNNKVSADELQARFRRWRESKIGRMQVSVTVFMDGQPLSGAEVQLVPESFLGNSLLAASGVTDNNGNAMPGISDKANGRGMQVGLYKIRISKKSGSTETIPEKYNKNSNLGVEISSDNSAVENGLTLKLTK